MGEKYYKIYMATGDFLQINKTDNQTTKQKCMRLQHIPHKSGYPTNQ